MNHSSLPLMMGFIFEDNFGANLVWSHYMVVVRGRPIDYIDVQTE